MRLLLVCQLLCAIRHTRSFIESNRPCVHSLYCVTFSSYLLFISYVHRFVYYALILICCFK